jgi:predicted transposase/invertase (TIGR01784 family)
MLDVLKKSKKRVPRFEEEMKLKKEKDKIREEARKEGREEGRKEGKEERSLEIAKELKKSGVSLELIAKSTGLSKEEIEKI